MYVQIHVRTHIHAHVHPYAYTQVHMCAFTDMHTHRSAHTHTTPTEQCCQRPLGKTGIRTRLHRSVPGTAFQRGWESAFSGPEKVQSDLLTAERQSSCRRRMTCRLESPAQIRSLQHIPSGGSHLTLRSAPGQRAAGSEFYSGLRSRGHSRAESPREGARPRCPQQEETGREQPQG